MTARTRVYFGKACKKHPEFKGERYLAGSKCVECQRIGCQSRYYRNPEADAERCKGWHARNREYNIARCRKRYYENRLHELLGRKKRRERMQREITQ